jgi:peptidoglycan hydrolase-like protein with peptidoglycan-binding domain
MRKSIATLVLGTASVLTFSVGLAAAECPGTSGRWPKAADIPAAFPTSEAGDSLRRDDIRWAQAELRYRGFYKGSLDGVVGPEMKLALRQFQKDNRLAQTAGLDAQTWEALTGDVETATGSSQQPDAGGRGPLTTFPDSHLGR